jgi:hypothetical protein
MGSPSGSGGGSAQSAGIDWTLPEGWAETQASFPLLAAFRTNGGSSDVRITVTRLSSRGGGGLSNLNRWRRQVGMPQVDSLSQQPKQQVTLAGETIPMFDLTGAAGGESRRIVVAMQIGSEESWFFKMTGPPEPVGAAKEPFRQFLQSVTFTGGAD